MQGLRLIIGKVVGKAKELSLIEIFLLALVVMLMVLMWYISDSIEPVLFLALFFGIVGSLTFLIIKIGEGKGFNKRATIAIVAMLFLVWYISGSVELVLDFVIVIGIVLGLIVGLGLLLEWIEKQIRTQKYKIKGILLIIFLIVIGSIGYTIYQKYSPLAELANCGNNCIDYKKMKVAGYETPVPDIKITNVDAERLMMDLPIIIRNPSVKDTETVKIDFDVSMEGKHLTKGTIPAYELPAMQNTTILIKDVAIKYEELREVFQVVATRHGNEIFREGKANISMTTDLLIYLPIEVFSINIYTFTIPIQIETEIPIDMLKQKGEAEKQIEEKIQTIVK